MLREKFSVRVHCLFVCTVEYFAALDHILHNNRIVMNSMNQTSSDERFHLAGNKLGFALCVARKVNVKPRQVGLVYLVHLKGIFDYCTTLLRAGSGALLFLLSFTFTLSCTPGGLYLHKSLSTNAIMHGSVSILSLSMILLSKKNAIYEILLDKKVSFNF